MVFAVARWFGVFCVFLVLSLILCWLPVSWFVASFGSFCCCRCLRISCDLYVSACFVDFSVIT